MSFCCFCRAAAQDALVLLLPLQSNASIISISTAEKIRETEQIRKKNKNKKQIKVPRPEFKLAPQDGK